MLKKFSHIILSVVLLVSTAGMVVSKHYCSGSFVSVSVFNEAESCCGESDCCHNETQVYQVKTDFSVPVIQTAPVLAEFDILGHDLFETNNLTLPEKENQAPFVSHSPPPKTIQTILSLKQVYLL
jgi:hypothetical protein